MRLSAGWGDIYPDALEGQYVEFGDNRDGLYVIRVTTMPERDIRESDHSDNSAYAYLRIVGDEVTVIERGLRVSPWDPRKVIVRDGRQLTADADKTVPEPESPPPPHAAPDPGPARAALTGGRFEFRLRARRAVRLEIRDARRPGRRAGAGPRAAGAGARGGAAGPLHVAGGPGSRAVRRARPGAGGSCGGRSPGALCRARAMIGQLAEGR